MRLYLASHLYVNYIPDAEGYPLSVTEYTPDNTGRIKSQGGVGPVFQPGQNSPSHTTKYYYAKPDQWELDQLFGSDVGFAKHYFKNMVVDPNGQVSISYLNGSGKTIATALAGDPPTGMDPVSSIVPASTPKITLLDSTQFAFNSSDLTITGATTYVSTMPNQPATLAFSIQKLIDHYPGGTHAICSNCYYDLNIKVVDECGNIIHATTTPMQIGGQTANCGESGLATDSVSVTLPTIGEYYFTYTLGFSKTVMNNYGSTRLIPRRPGQCGAVKNPMDFILPYLQGLNLEACLSDCSTALTATGHADLVHYVHHQ